MKKIVSLLVCAVIALFLISSMSIVSVGANASSPSRSSESNQYFFMPWICQFCGSQANYTSALKEYHNVFTAVSYEQYYLNPSNYSFSKFGLQSPRTLAEQYGLPVYPMVVSGDPAAMHVLFTNSNVQKKFISAAVANGTSKGYAGYNMDFEVPYYSDSANVTRFVNNFSVALEAAGMKLTLDVIGIYHFSPNAYGAAYNFSALGKTKVSLIMVEDYYSIGLFEKAVSFASARIPDSKLSIALPSYSYAFYVNASSPLHFPYNIISPYVNFSYSGMYGALHSILTTARKLHASVTKHWGSFYGEPYYKIIYGSSPKIGNEFYYINGKAMSLRLDYLQSHGIKKIEMWRLGSVDHNIWGPLYSFKQFATNAGIATQVLMIATDVWKETVGIPA